MEIKFVEGECVRGIQTIWSDINDCYVRGYFEVTRIVEYNYIRMQRMNQKVKIKKEIVVVKQKNKWQMFITLMHELAHWFVFTFITQKKVNKYDDWIDRKKEGE